MFVVSRKQNKMPHKIYNATKTSESNAAEVAVVGIFQDENLVRVLNSLSGQTGLVSEPLISNIAGAVTYEGFKGKVNQQLILPTYGASPAQKILLYGLGPASAWSATYSRKMAANIAKGLRIQPGKIVFVLRDAVKAESTADGAKDDAAVSTGATSASADSSAPSSASKADGGEQPFNKLSDAAAKEHVRAIAEGWVLGTYSFKKYKAPDKEDKPTVDSELHFAGLDLAAQQLETECALGQSIAEATNLARQMIAEPPSFMTPTKLAEHAQSIADEHSLQCQIMDADAIEKLGMGSFLGVSKGAKEPLRFIVMKYDAPESKKTVAIIGKGITFDSGGLSLKPAASMEHMKYDMSGAAAVIAAMQVVGKQKPAVSVLALVAAAENMPGSNALHPGDVLKAMNGKTIEVNNTDAEGRLVLADAMTYAVQQNVDEMIDLATLTGAIVTALGRAAAGIMGNNQALIDGVIKAGARAGEKLWQMPMYDEFKESLKSDIADLKNAGARGEAGSSSAAMFLQEFCGGKPWAHLDIAGPGWMEKPRDELNKGGTAFGVRTLCYYLLSL